MDLFQHAFQEREKVETKPFPLKAVMEAADPLAEDFEVWKLKPGANHVLKDLFKMAAGYASRYQRTGQRVSARLLWERERDQIKAVRMRLKLRGVALGDWRGYEINNNLVPLITRHIIDRRPDWKGLFEMRARKGEL